AEDQRLSGTRGETRRGGLEKKNSMTSQTECAINFSTGFGTPPDKAVQGIILEIDRGPRIGHAGAVAVKVIAIRDGRRRADFRNRGAGDPAEAVKRHGTRLLLGAGALNDLGNVIEDIIRVDGDVPAFREAGDSTGLVGTA